MAICWTSSGNREISADGAMLLRVEDGPGEEEKRVRVLFCGSGLCCVMWEDTAGIGMTLTG